MTVTIKNLIPSKYAENSQTSQYTAVDAKTVIDKFTATNTSASNVTISVNLVTNGSTASTNNLIVKSRVIAPNECYFFPELIGHILESGGFISTIVSAATSVVIRASGREVA
jgi:hypothetical protein